MAPPFAKCGFVAVGRCLHSAHLRIPLKPYAGGRHSTCTAHAHARAHASCMEVAGTSTPCSPTSSVPDTLHPVPIQKDPSFTFQAIAEPVPTNLPTAVVARKVERSVRGIQRAVRWCRQGNAMPSPIPIVTRQNSSTPNDASAASGVSSVLVDQSATAVASTKCRT